MEGIKGAIANVGAKHFYTSLFAVGLFYHLYNQVQPFSYHCVRTEGLTLFPVVCIQYTGTCECCVTWRV